MRCPLHRRRPRRRCRMRSWVGAASIAAVLFLLHPRHCEKCSAQASLILLLRTSSATLALLRHAVVSDYGLWSTLQASEEDRTIKFGRCCGLLAACWARGFANRNTTFATTSSIPGNNAPLPPFHRPPCYSRMACTRGSPTFRPALLSPLRCRPSCSSPTRLPALLLQHFLSNSRLPPLRPQNSPLLCKWWSLRRPCLLNFALNRLLLFHLRHLFTPLF